MNKGSLDKFLNIKRVTKRMINLDPLQTGGILTNEAHQALVEWGDGYSVCDFCQGNLGEIKKPPLYEFFHEALPEFIGTDIVIPTYGAREGKFMIMHAIAKPGDYIIIDKNAHYTTYLAAERLGLRIKEVANSGYPEYRIDENAYETVINQLRKKKINISLMLITWPDGNYGNLPDVKRVAEISRKFNIPLLINAAYAIGRMPVNLNEVGGDFVVGSGHKSMASSGPIGLIGMEEKWGKILLKKSQYFEKKEVEMLGCSARGVSVMTLMASFFQVAERVKKWPDQVNKARWFSGQLERLGIKQLGERPHRHDLMFFESERLYEISQKHKRGPYFLYEELKRKNIWGIKPGLTKHFKLSTFAATKIELEKVIHVFADILNKN